MPDRQRVSRGLSLIEILVGVVVFAVGMLPVLFLSHSTTMGAAALTRHVAAVHVAQGVLDGLLARPFAAARSRARELAGKPQPASGPDIAALVAGGGEGLASPGEFLTEVGRATRGMEYHVTMEEPAAGEDGADRLFLLTVRVTWREEGPSGQAGQANREWILQGIKYREVP